MIITKFNLIIILSLIVVTLKAQVGVNTDSPRTEVALDINGVINVTQRVFLGNEPLNQSGSSGNNNDIIVSAGSVNPTGWVKKTIPDGFGESFNLTYMNSYFDIIGIDVPAGGVGAYTFDQNIDANWRALTQLDNSFTVYKSGNKVNLIFQTVGQINNTGSSSASFACGIFMKLDSESTYKLKGVRTDAVRGSTGSNKIINMNVTLENLPIPGGAGGTVYNTRVACIGRNVTNGTFAIGKPINTTFLNQEMAQSSLNISVLESW